ncbi:hypothetical protein OG539_32555 [Actinacidiphila glaucinigra]|uniref:hypothetical protein n=1 Tax=Actinacidiphila glaucinigra TaxID=235986 RepID=UPI00324634D7
MQTEFLPARPRKTSASRRRRRITQLPYRLHQVVPGAAKILVTSVLMAIDDDSHVVYHLVVRDSTGRQIRVVADQREDIVALLQAAWPQADWSRAQTWTWRGNDLKAWRPATPADLTGWINADPAPDEDDDGPFCRTEAS